MNQASSLTQEPEPPLPPSSQGEIVPLPIEELIAPASLPINESSYTTSLQDCEWMLSNLSISQTSPPTALAAQEEGSPLLLSSLDEKSLAPTSPNSLTMTDPLEHALLPISPSSPKSFQ